uniref:Major facilitator superfamily (MFS) profile domain-containing protein n=1 Tax=Laticauda laticaudata TaxID=8630 RepID=A0A8C5SNA2_LATLA
MAFGELLEQIGGMGRFQYIHTMLLTIPVLFMASHNLLQNFTAAIPGHHCQVHLAPNGSEYPNITHLQSAGQLLRVSIPLDNKQRLEKCRRFTDAQWYLLNASVPRANETETEPCAEGWFYDQTHFTSTIVSEWDLVCDRRKLREMAQSIYMGGVLIGALVLGGLADRYVALIIWSFFQMAVTGTCAAFSPNYASYCFFRFLTGMAQSGFGLIVEWIPTQYRTITIALTGLSYTVGQILLAGLAYSIRDWRWLQVAVSAPYLAFLLYSWYVWYAESARWLIQSGQASKAVGVLQRVARINKKEEAGARITTEVWRKRGGENSPSHCKKMFSVSFSYYGLVMDLQNFGVSIYLIQVIFGAVDFPAKLIVTITMSYIGRRVSLTAFLVTAGTIIITNLFVPLEMQTLRTALAVIGKGCLSAAFNCIFLFTTELYPTPVRQTGLGFGSTMARVGGMVSPLTKMLEDYYSFLPPIVYGVFPITAGIIACLLPETLNVPLPDTIEDVENSPPMLAREFWELKSIQFNYSMLIA